MDNSDIYNELKIIFDGDDSDEAKRERVENRVAQLVHDEAEGIQEYALRYMRLCRGILAGGIISGHKLSETEVVINIKYPEGNNGNLLH